MANDPSNETLSTWIENLEKRVEDIEVWQEKYEVRAIQGIHQYATLEANMRNMEVLMAKQDAHIEKMIDTQNRQHKENGEKIEKFGDKINKILFGMLGTAIMMLLKVVLDLTILKH